MRHSYLRCPIRIAILYLYTTLLRVLHTARRPTLIALVRIAGCPTPNALLCIAGCPTQNALLRISVWNAMSALCHNFFDTTIDALIMKFDAVIM